MLLVLNMLEFWIYRGYVYVSGFKYVRVLDIYVRVLDIPFPKHKKNFYKENIRKIRFLKIRKTFFGKI